MRHFLKSIVLETLTIDPNVKAVIIGFWRMGATTDEIMEILRLRYMLVQQVIIDYENEYNAFNKTAKP